MKLHTLVSIISVAYAEPGVNDPTYNQPCSDNQFCENLVGSGSCCIKSAELTGEQDKCTTTDGPDTFIAKNQVCYPEAESENPDPNPTDPDPADPDPTDPDPADPDPTDPAGPGSDNDGGAVSYAASCLLLFSTLY